MKPKTYEWVIFTRCAADAAAMLAISCVPEVLDLVQKWGWTYFSQFVAMTVLPVSLAFTYTMAAYMQKGVEPDTQYLIAVGTIGITWAIVMLTMNARTWLVLIDCAWWGVTGWFTWQEIGRRRATLLKSPN